MMDSVFGGLSAVERAVSRGRELDDGPPGLVVSHTTSLPTACDIGKSHADRSETTGWRASFGLVARLPDHEDQRHGEEQVGDALAHRDLAGRGVGAVASEVTTPASRLLNG